MQYPSDPRILPFRRHEGIPPKSWLSAVLQQVELVDDEGHMLPMSFSYGAAPTSPIVRLVSLDIGNDALKAAVLSPERTFVTTRIPTTYEQVSLERYTEGHATFLLEDEVPFRIDVRGGESLPLGPTDQRLGDSRYQRFVRAAIVQALIDAGYQPGSYQLVVGVGVRNEEIDEREGRQQVQEKVAEALRQMKGEYTLTHSSEGTSSSWRINILAFHPAAQTVGTYFAWGLTLTGKRAQDEITKLAILDYGGYDTHALSIDISGKRLSGKGEQIGLGTISVARRLIDLVKEVHGIPLTPAKAQAALISGTTRIGGREESISHLILAARRASVEDILGRTMPTLQDRESYIIHTGGGAILLKPEIEERMKLAGCKPNQYLILPAELAGISNVIGLWAYAYTRAVAR